MRKLLTILFILTTVASTAQVNGVYQENRSFGFQYRRLKSDSTLHIPTFCGTPTLRNSPVGNQAAIGYDSCHGIFYVYNPKDSLWSQVTGSGTGIDSISLGIDYYYLFSGGVLKDSVGLPVDTLKVSNDFVVEGDTLKLKADSLHKLSYRDDVDTSGVSPMEIPVKQWVLDRLGSGGLWTAKDSSTYYKKGNVLIGTDVDDGHTLRVNGTVEFNLGSDAEGDLFYRNSLGSFVRLPVGTAGQALRVVGGVPAWVDTTAAGGSPGGSDTQVQFNDGGVFGGGSSFVWDKTLNNLSVGTSQNSSTNINIINTSTGLKAKSALFLWNGPDTSNVGYLSLFGKNTSDALYNNSLLLRSAYNVTGGINISSSHGVKISTNDSTFSDFVLRNKSMYLYNTKDTTNYEAGVFKWSANKLIIGTENGGTASARDSYLISANTNNLVAGSNTPTRIGKGDLSSAIWGIHFNINANDDYNIGFGVDMTGSNTYRARGNGSAANPAMIRMVGGDLVFYADQSKTDLVTYTPTERFRIKKTGQFIIPATNTATGTTGDRTINQPAGSVNFAAGATSITVTDSFVTTSSLIFLQVYGTDATAKSATVTVSSGAFIITLNAAATAETKVAFKIIN